MPRPRNPLRTTGALTALAIATLLTAAGWVVSACTTPHEGAKGTSCDRAAECAAGLFCVERVCSDDLTKLDGGNVPQIDTGADVAELDGDADETSEAGDVGPADAPMPQDSGQAPDTRPTTDTRPLEDTMPPGTDTEPLLDTQPIEDTATDDAGAD